MSTISAGTTTTTALVQTGDTTGNLVLATGATPTTALTLDSTTQAATFAGAVTAPSVTATAISTTGTINAANTFGFKNRIINGGMTIDQRNAGASTTPAASGYLLDRFAWLGSLGSKLTFGQNLNSATPPTGFINYLGAQTASAYTPGTSEYFSLYQAIEGLNMADLAWGTANAKTVTLSFQVYSSLTGTFGGSIYNNAGNRCYPIAYSIPVANTWTTISVTIAGDTTGTWLTTNGVGMVVMFGLGAGATVSGTAGAWGSTLYRSSTGAVQVVATAGATFYITGVQLEVGSQATSFDFRDYGRELILCQRYYYKQTGASNYGRFGSGFCGGGTTTSAYITVNFPVNLRSKPTSIDWSGALGTWNGGGINAVSAVALESGSEMTTSAVAIITSSGMTSQTPYILIGNNSSTAAIAFNAEL